jgi:hypothetical protein
MRPDTMPAASVATTQQTARRHAGAGPHHRARSSASPPVPRQHSTSSSLGLKYPGGLGAAPPMRSAPQSVPVMI